MGADGKPVKPPAETGAGDSTKGSRLGEVADPGPDSNASTGIPGSANKDKVTFGYITGLQGTADRYLSTGEGRYVAGNRETIVYEAQKYLGDLRAKAKAPNATKADKNAYNDFVSALKNYTGSDFKTTSGEDAAWSTVLKDAAGNNVNAMDLLRSSMAGVSADTSGGTRSGSYAGPTSYRTMQAESDIKATANALAIELIGRPVTDQELNKLVQRMRSAEMQQPEIRTSTTGSATTMQGLTAQGREDILREVISQNPEYEKFQIDTTVLDAMTNFIDKKKQVSGG